MSDRVKSLGKIHSGKDCMRASLGLVKPIAKRLRKITDFIESRRIRTETSVVGRGNGDAF